MISISTKIKKQFDIQASLSQCKRGINRFIKKVNGTSIETDLKHYQQIVNKIRAAKNNYSKQSDQHLQRLSLDLRSRYQQNKNFDEIKVEAFALAVEVIARKLKLKPFDQQLITGLALHDGKLAEMQTGEGKTLAAVFPAYLNALSGHGVHVLTFNDYLAKRDAEWMQPVYSALGLNIASIQQGMDSKQRRKAYQADITYLTAKEFGFDYLRDGLCYKPEDEVQQQRFLQPGHFTVIDEADSILIDEARVPLILAISADEGEQELLSARNIVKQLAIDTHICFDEHRRNVDLTEAGVAFIEALPGLDNLYSTMQQEKLTNICYALHAEHLVTRGVDYLVKNQEISLIDEFTGRIAENRRWPDGLHAAVEVKEGLLQQRSGAIQNSISLQHLLRLCPKLSGMSATCETSAEEFQDFYQLQTVIIPPHKKKIRIDHADRIFLNQTEKHKALTEEILKVHQSGRPILVGTASVNESYQLQQTLSAQGITVNLLNADRDREEASIIADAGRLGAVTISTNMAGRGTDILLGGQHSNKDSDETLRVKSLGGLYVIGTNRHESPRIDGQLRGRAGRQGDPGSSIFFVSLEDPLYQRFKLRELFSAKILELVNNVDSNSASGQEITSVLIRKKLDQIQRIIDGENHQIRKTLFQYSYIVDQQRLWLRDFRAAMVDDEKLLRLFSRKASKHYQFIVEQLGLTTARQACTRILCHCIDEHWRLHLGAAADLQHSVPLQIFGGNTPLFEFQKQIANRFETFFDDVERLAIDLFNKVEIIDGRLDLDKTGMVDPSSTWTYQVKDAFFDDMRNEIFAQGGLAASGAFAAAPFIVLLGPLPLLFMWIAGRFLKKK